MNEDEMITRYPNMGLADRLWWREALTEFGFPHSVALIAWADRYGLATQDGEPLDKVAVRLIRSGCPPAETLQALRDIRRLCRRLGRAYVQEAMGQAPTDKEVVEHLRLFGILIAA